MRPGSEVPATVSETTSAEASGRPEISGEEGLIALRGEFPILETTTYLISNSLGAMPRGVRDSLATYADEWATRGVRSWEEGWWEMPMQIGDLIAPLIGAPAGTVAAQPNVTIASAIAASCIDFGGGRDRIVTSELHFPSLLYLHRRLEQRGARLTLVPCPDGRTVPLDRLLEAIDERTALVPISHVIFRSSFRQDVAAIVQRAHECGARVVVDVYQSAGILPVEVLRWGVDFAVGGTLKWLCGGPGVAFLYAHPDSASSLEPSLTGWQAHQDPFGFDSGPQRYRDDGWRFLTGTPQIPALLAAKPGLEILGRLDRTAVREKSSRQTQRIIDYALGHGWAVATPVRPDQRGGAVTLAVPDAQRCTRELLARDVLIDFRPGAGIRMAPHFYTEDAEIDFALDLLASLVSD